MDNYGFEGSGDGDINGDKEVGLDPDKGLLRSTVCQKILAHSNNESPVKISTPNMGPKTKKKVTRQISSEKWYGGGPQDLPENVIPTYRDIARYHHFIVETQSVKISKVTLTSMSKMILEKLKLVWTKVRDKMPFLSDLSIIVKIKRFLVKVRGVHNKLILRN